MYFNVDTPQPPIRQLATYFVVVWDQGPIQKKPEESVGLLPVESHLHTNQEDLTLSVLWDIELLESVNSHNLTMIISEALLF